METIKHIFIAGAAGYVGNAVARAFRAKGHTVYGLVRSEEETQLLSQNEVWPIQGDLEYPESYQKILSEVVVAVHCGFDFTSGKGVENDAKTIDAILQTFSKSSLPRSFIDTSGVWVYGSREYQMIVMKLIFIIIPGAQKKNSMNFNFSLKNA